MFVHEDEYVEWKTKKNLRLPQSQLERSFHGHLGFHFSATKYGCSIHVLILFAESWAFINIILAQTRPNFITISDHLNIGLRSLRLSAIRPVGAHPSFYCSS